MENEAKGSLLIVLACLMYSFIGVFSRFAGINLFALVFYKEVLAALFFFFIFLFARKDAGKLKMNWEMAKFFIPYALVVTITEVTFIGAYLNTSMINAIFLGGLTPVFVAVLSFFFLKEKLNLTTLLSLILGVTGIGFIAGADLLGVLNGKNLLGDALAVIYAIAYAVFIIYGRERAKRKVDIYYSVFWSYAIAALFLLPVDLVYGTLAIPLESVVWIVLLAFLCTNIAFILFCKGFEYIDAPKGSIVTLAEQVFVTINAFLFFGENLSLFAVIGAVLICSSVVLEEMR